MTILGHPPTIIGSAPHPSEPMTPTASNAWHRLRAVRALAPCRRRQHCSSAEGPRFHGCGSTLLGGSTPGSLWTPGSALASAEPDTERPCRRSPLDDEAEGKEAMFSTATAPTRRGRFFQQHTMSDTT